MGRRELRESIFHLLFMTEFNASEEMEAQIHLYLEGLENPTESNLEYIKNKFENICEKKDCIDEKLNEVSKGWKTSRMGKVELTILRLATYEVLYDEDVPEGVAINEAVELAKKFGGDDSPSFVNGVLGKLVKSNE